MEGYFDKLKSKKALGGDFNKRYFAVVRTPENRFMLNYYNKRGDLTDGSKPNGSIELKDISFVGVYGQPVQKGGQPHFKVGDPAKSKQRHRRSDSDSSSMSSSTVMEKHAARGIQISSKTVNMFIVADNKSMAHKWTAGLCIMLDMPLPPGVGWPKKFGSPPPCLAKLAIAEKARQLEGYFNTLVVEKGTFVSCS